MSKFGYSYFESEIAYIAAVTKMLNSTELPENDNMYIHVELRDSAGHTVVGRWSDEIAPDAWYYEEQTGD